MHVLITINSHRRHDNSLVHQALYNRSTLNGQRSTPRHPRNSHISYAGGLDLCLLLQLQNVGRVGLDTGAINFTHIQLCL